MYIRNEKESDIQQITEIHKQAFKGTDEGRIVERLRGNKHLTISLVCEIDDKVVGHIAYSPIFHKDEVIGLGLAPVAVLPEFQKRGSGSALIKAGNELARSKGFTKIFVLGDPDYYLRFGFLPAKEYNYFSKYDPEGEHFMILKGDVKPEAEKIDIEYCKEFEG
jgi:putative acetyltransferase